MHEESRAMSYCKESSNGNKCSCNKAYLYATCTTGKDKDIFITKEDYENPEVREELIVTEDYGPILPSGEINWDCPCLGGMAHGPCGEEFRAAFSCFVYSEAEEKGTDCLSEFQTMQNCMEQHPEVYHEEQDEEESESDNLTKDTNTGSSLLTDDRDNSETTNAK